MSDDAMDFQASFMITAAAALNAEMIHRDNDITTVMEKLITLEHEVQKCRALLEGEVKEGWVSLDDLRQGALFVEADHGTLAVKSEYRYPDGTPDCILLASGEHAHFKFKGKTLVREVFAKNFDPNTRSEGEKSK